MKTNEFITVAAVSGALAAIGSMSAFSPPCAINDQALKTIESQNERLSAQNEKLAQANKVIQDALAKLPDDQHKLTTLLVETDTLKKNLEDQLDKGCKK